MADVTIAVDHDHDSDGGYETAGSEYSTESLASSIYNYRFLDGRRYHSYAEGKYGLPNDETEQDRLDIIHHVCLLLLNNKLHMAPIDPNPQRILDIGTGTGIWAIDAGEYYPSAEVIGTDLSPIQPSWVPPNVQFQIDDAESEWTWAKNSFDLIHIRHLNGSIKDWPTFLKQAFKHLKPGGYIDIHEYEVDLFSDDGTYTNKSSLFQYYTFVNKAAAKSGRPFESETGIKRALKDAGFDDVHYEMKKCPFGTWPADPKQKEIGAFCLLTAENAFEAFGLVPLTQVLGMPLNEARELIETAKKDARNRKIHSYAKQHYYYSKKPKDY